MRENIQREDTIRSEDTTRARHILKHLTSPELLTVTPHPRKPKKAELMNFVRGQASMPNGGWKAALKDPDAAAAMRALQRRVKKLDDFDAPPQPPWVEANDWSYR